jgi:arylformamidase
MSLVRKRFILCGSLAALGASLLMPAFAGPLKDAIVDRMLTRKLEQAQEGGAAAMEGQMLPVPLPPGARLEKDFSYGSDPAQKMDIYIPQHTGLAPVIFMVHGGAWMVGDKGMSKVIINKAARWLPKGYVIVSVNYPMLPNSPVDQQARDVAKALSVAQANATAWGADASRFVLMGHSAGAHLVTLLSADPQIAYTAGAKPWLGTVSLDSASMDVVKTMEDKHYSFYDKVFGSDPNFWRQVSPYQRLTKAPPGPVLMVCGTGRADSCPQAQAFAQKVISLGGKATVLPQGMNHGDINGKLGEPGAYTETVENFLRSLGVS